MVRVNTVVCVAAILALVFQPSSLRAKQGQTVSLPLQGITIDTDEAGNLRRIYATGRQPVEFPDSRGISTAQKIAEERAKAEIIKFLQQDVTSQTLVNELEATSTTTSRYQGASADGISKEGQRRLATSLSETIGSFSKGTLRGVVVLEAGYDDKREEAWVRVGVSQETMAMARSTQNALAGRGSPNGSGSNPTATAVGAGGTSEPVVRQPSEVRRGADLPASPRGFTSARGFVRGLHLKSRAEWDAYVKSGEKPADIPANPDEIYKAHWISWEDWLGR